MLSEPVVLARAKKFLLCSSNPSTKDTIRYATVDTQFRRDIWPNAGPVNPDTRDVLAPFNHVPLGSGYPDMVVAGPPPGFLNSFQIPDDSLPIIAVEAKGETKNRSGTEVPAETAILQAHDRLSESNASLAVVPDTATTSRVQQLARELDVGLLSVSESEVALVEPPVPKGVSASATASAVRWQAGAQRVAGQSFHYNHPKTYIGIPLAIAADNDTKTVFKLNIAKKGFSSGKAGARFLGLVVTDQAGKLTLTTLGKEVIRFAMRKHGSVDAALAEMETWGGRGNRTDLIDRDEGWGEFTRSILTQYPATSLLIDTIEEETPSSASSGDPAAGPTLPSLVQSVYNKRPTFAVELFIREDSEARGKVFEKNDVLSREALEDTDIYQSTTVYQYKMMLRHSGILHPEVTVNSTDKLSPTTDHWTLRNTICR